MKGPKEKGEDERALQRGKAQGNKGKHNDGRKVERARLALDSPVVTHVMHRPCDRIHSPTDGNIGALSASPRSRLQAEAGAPTANRTGERMHRLLFHATHLNRAEEWVHLRSITLDLAPAQKPLQHLWRTV